MLVRHLTELKVDHVRVREASVVLGQEIYGNFLGVRMLQTRQLVVLFEFLADGLVQRANLIVAADLGLDF